MRLNCQFDLMELGQSPDGLGRDSHHHRRLVSLIALAVPERGLGRGARQPPPRKSSRSADEPSTIRPHAEQED